MSVYELGNGLRLVDLTKVLDPATESRRCHLIRYNTGGPIPDFHTDVVGKLDYGYFRSAGFDHTSGNPLRVSLPSF